jgi:riboflavin kinase
MSPDAVETRTLRPFVGMVQSGLGDFSIWMKKLSELYQEKTGVQLFPGTLNVWLETEYNLPDQRIRLEGMEYGGNVSVNIIPCKIFDQPAFVLRTDKNDAGLGDHPRNIVEIAAEVKLRDRFGLKDGDQVEVWLP